MEPEGSLPRLLDPATCPYPEPDKPIPCPPSHFLKIHLNIKLPSTPGSPKWSLSLRFPHQNFVYASPLPHSRYMPRPSHSSRFVHLNNIWYGLQLLKLLIMNLLHFHVSSSLLSQIIVFNTLFSTTLSIHTSFNVSDQSHPHITTGKIIVLYILIFIQGPAESLTIFELK